MENNTTRIKQSLGEHYHNIGTKMAPNEGKFQVDYSREFYLFDVVPVGAPRMTQSDKWKSDPNHSDPKRRKRATVQNYHEFKDAIKAQAGKMSFELGDYFDVVFFLSMPASWSNKKKERENGLPCRVKPDFDNLVKCIGDTFRPENDSAIWKCGTEKRWAYKSSILIYV